MFLSTPLDLKLTNTLYTLQIYFKGPVLVGQYTLQIYFKGFFVVVDDY